MTLSLSPPIRYAALAALLGALLLGGGMTMLGHGRTSVAAPHVIKHHPFGPGVNKKVTVAPKKHSTKAAKAKATPTVPVAPKAAVQPSFVIDVTPFLEKKLQAIACYHSQFILGRTTAAPTFLDEVRTLAAYWGYLIGRGYGEPFCMREEVGLGNLNHVLVD